MSSSPKLTRNPVHNQLVTFDFIACGAHNLEKRIRSVFEAALGIQGFTQMLLLVCVKHGTKGHDGHVRTIKSRLGAVGFILSRFPCVIQKVTEWYLLESKSPRGMMGCGGLVTELLNGFLEIRNFMFSMMYVNET